MTETVETAAGISIAVRPKNPRKRQVAVTRGIRAHARHPVGVGVALEAEWLPGGM